MGASALKGAFGDRRWKAVRVLCGSCGSCVGASALKGALGHQCCRGFCAEGVSWRSLLECFVFFVGVLWGLCKGLFAEGAAC